MHCLSDAWLNWRFRTKVFARFVALCTQHIFLMVIFVAAVTPKNVLVAMEEYDAQHSLTNDLTLNHVKVGGQGLGLFCIVLLSHQTPPRRVTCKSIESSNATLLFVPQLLHRPCAPTALLRLPCRHPHRRRRCHQSAALKVL